MARSKYGNKRTVIGDLTFDSKAEAGRWMELCALELGKEIAGLERQKRFPIIVAGKKICDYLPDFTYVEIRADRVVCEDVKSAGTATPEWRLKWKLVQALVPGIDWRVIDSRQIRATVFGKGVATSAGSRRAA